jgi:membrane protein YqaA with SNARE-associated domain
MLLLSGCFAWGLAEATVFFVVPELSTASAAILVPDGWHAFGLAAVAGALAGGAAMFAAGARAEDRAMAMATRLPGHPPAFVHGIRREFRERGWPALLSGGFRGRPFKLYAIEAGAAGRGPLAFLAVGGVARAARILLVTWIAARVELALGHPALSWRDALAFFAVGLAAIVAYLAIVERRYPRRTNAEHL